MALSGHRSVVTVMKHYAEVDPAELRKAVDALECGRREEASEDDQEAHRRGTRQGR